MKIIDAHAHIFPEKISEAAVNSIGSFYGLLEMAHGGTSEELISSGSKIGVEKYMVFSTATTPKQVTSINNFIVSECEQHPEFIGVGTMHSEFEDFESEIDRIYRLGIRGIKLHPDFQQFYIDDDKLLPLYAILEDRDMFLITHSGDYRYDFSRPERIAKVAKMYPKMRVIAAHFGGWAMWTVARRELTLPNVYIDTSSTLVFSGDVPAKEAFKAFDNTHIFFGVDFPTWDHTVELEYIMKLGLDDATLENVLYNNFNNFYYYK